MLPPSSTLFGFYRFFRPTSAASAAMPSAHSKEANPASAASSASAASACRDGQVKRAALLRAAYDVLEGEHKPMVQIEAVVPDNVNRDGVFASLDDIVERA